MSLLSLAIDRLTYLRRIAAVYLARGSGPLAFWYETPRLNEPAFVPDAREYFMVFQGKAEYRGPYDEAGIPLLDYKGQIGRQYNPIAIAQYGLAAYNVYLSTGADERRTTFLRMADWLVENLSPNGAGVNVWWHRFNWPYRELLVAPWYSGLAQGQGVSLLVRAARETGDARYAAAADAAVASLLLDPVRGGVTVRDADGRPWIEEYLVTRPTHILNGFVWALWGIYDFAQWSGAKASRELFDECVQTLKVNLHRYDAGYWSRYELSSPAMLASPYYHALHVVQLAVLYRQTGEDVFRRYAERWEAFAHGHRRRLRALMRKSWFKVWNY